MLYNKEGIQGGGGREARSYDIAGNFFFHRQPVRTSWKRPSLIACIIFVLQYSKVGIPVAPC